MLTVKDLAARFQVKAKTVYAWASQGTLPCLKINGVLRFDAEDIERWLEGCRIQAGGRALQVNRKSSQSRKAVDVVIERVKRAGYTPRHGETRPTASPKGKEEDDGAR